MTSCSYYCKRKSVLWIPTSLEEFEKIDFSAILDSKLMQAGGIWIGCKPFSLKFFDFRLEIGRSDPQINRKKLDFFKETYDHKIIYGSQILLASLAHSSYWKGSILKLNWKNAPEMSKIFGSQWLYDKLRFGKFELVNILDMDWYKKIQFDTFLFQ